MSQSPQAFSARLAAFVQRRDALIRWFSFALLLLSATALFRLEIDVGLISMLPQGRPTFAAYAEFIERFAERDSAIAVVRAPDAARAIRFADAFSQALREEKSVAGVRGRLDVDDFMAAAQAGAAVRFTPRSPGDGLTQRIAPESAREIVRTLRMALGMPGSAGVGARLARDPFGLSLVLADALALARPDRTLAAGSDYLLSADATRLLLLIQPAASGYSLPEVEELAAALARAEERARRVVGMAEAERVEVGYTGAFAYAGEDAAIMRADLIRYTAIAFVGVLLVFFIGARSGRFLPLLGYHLLLGSLVTLALGLAIFGRLNVISLAFAAVFYGLAIDAAIHLHTRFREELAAGRDASEAIAATLQHITGPTILAALTTAIAFSLLGAASLTGIAQLGVLTAIGIVWNAFATLVVLPAFLQRGVQSWRPPGQARWLARIAGGVVRHRVRVAIGLGGIAIVLLVGIPRARLDSDLFALRPLDSAASRVQEEIEREFGFTNPHGSVMVDVPPGQGRAGDEKLLRAVEAVTARLEELAASGEVLSITSPAVLLPSLATQEERIEAWRALPRKQAADALAAALVEGGFRLPPFRAALDALASVPQSLPALEHTLPGTESILEHHVRRDAAGTAVLVSFTPRDVGALATVADLLANDLPLPQGVELRVAGRPLLERELRMALGEEVAFFLIAVLLTTLLLLAWRERELRVVLALLALPVVSVLTTLGASGWLGIPFTPVNVIVLPLVAGIALDDGLFLVARLREEGAIVPAMAKGGRALGITTATTMVGFGALSLSHYPALASLGQMAAAGLLGAFLVMLFLLPLLLPDATPGERLDI
ncbi:MAG: MMPL family transporter [bacterium]